jgi:hypothetical protein
MASDGAGILMKKKATKLTPSQRATKAAAASPWKNKPGCPTKRAADIFRENQRTPHPSKRK